MQLIAGRAIQLSAISKPLMANLFPAISTVNSKSYKALKLIKIAAYFQFFLNIKVLFLLSHYIYPTKSALNMHHI